MSRISVGVQLISMPRSHYYHHSRSPSHNDGQSTILKGASGSRESSEESVQMPEFYWQPGSPLPRSTLGFQIYTQFLPGATPPPMRETELKVIYSEIRSPLTY